MSDNRLLEIERKACSDPCFSDEEKQTIREVIKVYRGWQFIAKVVRGSAVFIGGCAALYVAIKTLAGVL